jgi:hypothetical protein
MRLYVPLSQQEYEALERLAFAERRRPRDQAAAMLAALLSSSTQRNQASEPNTSTPEVAVAGSACGERDRVCA